MLSLKNLLEDLKSMFNVYWFIDQETGRFRIEHLSYFEVQGIVDLTLEAFKKFTVGKREYQYQREKQPKFEKLIFAEGSTDDFKEGIIEHTSACVNKKSDENTKEISVSNIATDLYGLIFNSDDYRDEGFVLFSTANGAIEYEVGDLTGFSKPNGHLSAANLFKRYHLHGRVLTSGLMNHKAVAFLSTVRTKKQVALSIPRCQLQPLNLLAKFVTALGDNGQLEKAEFSPRTGRYSLTILNDASTEGLLPVNYTRQFDDSLTFHSGKYGNTGANARLH